MEVNTRGGRELMAVPKFAFSPASRRDKRRSSSVDLKTACFRIERSGLWLDADTSSKILSFFLFYIGGGCSGSRKQQQRESSSFLNGVDCMDWSADYTLLRRLPRPCRLWWKTIHLTMSLDTAVVFRQSSHRFQKRPCVVFTLVESNACSSNI